MNRRSFLNVAPFAPLAYATAQQFPQPEPAGHEAKGPALTTRPNVLWILGDQFRAQALQSYGDPNSRTPNLGRAEENGLTFTGHVSGFPLCCPFRGSMLTSRYPHLCVPGHEYPLPKGEKTVADVFNANGYHTAYFGKWHLGGWHERDGRAAFFITDPDRRGGFETWSAYENNNSQWDSWVHGGSGKDAFHYRLPGYETDELTNLMVNYIKDRAAEKKQGNGKPFFGVLSVQPPHDPYVAPEKFMANYTPARIQLRENVAHSHSLEPEIRRNLAGYYAQIENLDWNYGRVVRALEEAGMLQDTHIVFFADHGDMHGSHGLLRKTCPYEESIRTPYIISGGVPRPPAMKVGRRPVISNHVDIAPTTLGLCGIKKPEWMRGADLSHHRLNKPAAGPEPDSAYLQNVVPTGHPDSINTPYRGLVTRDGWKYVCFENRSWLLFNLNDDPFEEANLAQNNKFRAERKQMISRLKQWVADEKDKFAIPED